MVCALRGTTTYFYYIMINPHSQDNKKEMIIMLKVKIQQGNCKMKELCYKAEEIVMSKNKTRKEKYTHFSIKRAEKKNYTRMCNYHLRSKNLSLKAIGLHSKILSLSDEWNFSISGLIAICKESETAVRTAMKELEDWGYLKITKLKPDQTASGRIEYEYVFYEYSEKDKTNTDTYSKNGKFSTDYKTKATSEAEKQGIENLHVEDLYAEKLPTENNEELNTYNKIYKKKELKDLKSINQSGFGNKNHVENSTDGVIDRYNRKEYTKVVMENIRFRDLVDWLGDEDEALEIVDIIVGQIWSSKATETICGQEYSREIVKSTMMKVDLEVIENAIDQVKRSGNVKNYEKYLISTIFNEVTVKHSKTNNEARWADYEFKKNFLGH